jgi:hypothetical protein
MAHAIAEQTSLSNHDPIINAESIIADESVLQQFRAGKKVIDRSSVANTRPPRSRAIIPIISCSLSLPAQ